MKRRKQTTINWIWIRENMKGHYGRSMTPRPCPTHEQFPTRLAASKDNFDNRLESVRTKTNQHKYEVVAQ